MQNTLLQPNPGLKRVYVYLSMCLVLRMHNPPSQAVLNKVGTVLCKGNARCRRVFFQDFAK